MDDVGDRLLVRCDLDLHRVFVRRAFAASALLTHAGVSACVGTSFVTKGIVFTS